MDRIGIFGGSFNPIHNGHISLAQAAAQEFYLSKVLIMPCRKPPHKQAPDLAGETHRLEMCRLACRGMDSIEVSDIELNMPVPSYTYDTVIRLRQTYPDSSLYLIIGADMLLSFDKWQKWKELGSMVTLLAGARLRGQNPELDAKKKELEAAGVTAEIFCSEIVEISSTEIRTLVSQGKDISIYVPPEVNQYIQLNRLYEKLEV